jgi:hypothetical protein
MSKLFNCLLLIALVLVIQTSLIKSGNLFHTFVLKLRIAKLNFAKKFKRRIM